MLIAAEGRGLASRSVVDFMQHYAMEVLRLLVNRLQDGAFFKAETAKQVLECEVVGMTLSERELQEVSDDLLLQIRERGYETFAELELPKQNDLITHRCTDRKSGVSVRVVRIYDPIQANFLNRFAIGVA